MKEHPWAKTLFLLGAAVFFGAMFLGGGQSAPSFAQEPELPQNPVAGSEVFINKGCPKCHNIWGDGGTVGPDLGKIQFHLSFMDFAGLMWNHSPQMERKFREVKFRRPLFTSAEMKSLIAFLFYLDYFDQPGDPVKGEKIFGEKKCGTCHMIGGEGGDIGPPLDRFKQYASPIFIATALWNKGNKMAQARQDLDMKGPLFKGNDVADILSYIKVAGVLTKEPVRVYVTPGNPNIGRELLAEKKCLQCHFDGSEPEPGKVGLRAPDLKGSLSQIAGTIWNHGRRMWSRMEASDISVPQLTEEEMSNIIAYLYILQHIDEPGDAERGKRLFQEDEKGCEKCHSIGSVGGDIDIAPDLAAEKNLDTSIDIIRAMWNHGAEMEKIMQEEGVTWPRMEKGEMMDLIEFIQSERLKQ